ncbi:hypothetical protein C8J57DRAFT_1376559 [Mycena rebaudengoi]|nr:hypothetical protein C8J57DRAFT_1376559 [Mycena rebaudengoi]
MVAFEVEEMLFFKSSPLPRPRAWGRSNALEAFNWNQMQSSGHNRKQTTLHNADSTTCMTLSTTSAAFPLDVDSEDASLPFTVPDSMDELFPQVSVRDPDSINYVSAEAWKSFRITQAKSKSTLQDLSMFPAMQLDIVLEILGYLHPLELLHAPITELTWQNSFLVENDPDCAAADSFDLVFASYELPQCPAQTSGLWWVKFLFGPRICQECGQSGADADHLLLRRVCLSCLEKSGSNSGFPLLLDQTIHYLFTQS